MTDDRFTDRASKALALAQQGAGRLDHAHTGTEHILLGIFREEGAAARVLQRYTLSVSTLESEIRRLHQKGLMSIIMPPPSAAIPFTQRAEKLLAAALEEAQALGQPKADVEHLLLGLLRRRDCGAAKILLNLGLGLERIRGSVLETLGKAPPGPPGVRAGLKPL